MKKVFKLFAVFFALMLCLRLHVSAASEVYVRDEYGLLSADELAQLNDTAARVSQAHQTGVYVRVMNSMENYLRIEDYAEAVYISEDMGYGSTQDGILLILDMDTRSFDIFVPHGGKAEQAFSQYAREKMADTVVNDYLRYNEFAAGFSNYIAIADTDLSYAEAGTPLSPDFDPEREEQERREQEQKEAAERAAKTGATAGIPPIAAILACLGMRSKNKTAGIKTEAHDYIPKDGIHLTNRHDVFLYRTESRTVIHRDSDDRGGSGSSFSSSSSSFGSHTSGHF